jgi:hypothetical protein
MPYSCAAKYKSTKALRGDRALFDQLSMVSFHTSNDIATKLVLSLPTGPLSVRSDRSFIPHTLTGNQLTIYVPADRKQRQTSYRSQLPKFFANFLGVDEAALFGISSIITSHTRDLDGVLSEQDIPFVSWIEKPVIVLDEPSDPEPSGTFTPEPSGSDTATSADERPRPFSPEIPTPTPTRHGRTVDAEDGARSQTPPQFGDFIDRVVRSAQRASGRQRDGVNNEAYPVYNHVATFGNRELNEWAHDRRIGAAGEAFVSPFQPSLPPLAYPLTPHPGLRNPNPPRPPLLHTRKLAQHHPRRSRALDALRRPARLDRPRNRRYRVP